MNGPSPVEQVDTVAAPRRARLQACAEVALVLALFALQGTWPPPDVNEPNYLCKAVRFWQPDYARGDFFLSTPDTHKLFCWAVGWIALWCDVTTMAWIVRVVQWVLLAWTWRRLSVAVLPVRWSAVLTGALLGMLLERGHMAGEWVIGGAEAKVFAFPLMFLGMEALVRQRWNRAWILFGAAAAFHVLVGGWSVLAGLIAWAVLRDRPSLVRMMPGLVVGFGVSLIGLVPSLAMNWGVDRATVDQANHIYVVQRLSHHLDPRTMADELILRFVVLTVAWAIAALAVRGQVAQRRLAAFVLGAVVIAAIGTAIAATARWYPVRAEGLLRFYWFRLADLAVPLGVSVAVAGLLAEGLARRRAPAWIGLAMALAATGYHYGDHLISRVEGYPAVADQDPFQDEWLEACRWVAGTDKVPRNAVFFTPRLSQSFRWYTGRGEACNWKEIPQDARSIVAWWRRLRDIYFVKAEANERKWLDSLCERDAPSVAKLAARYHVTHLITQKDPQLPFELLYTNEKYAVYRIR